MKLAYKEHFVIFFVCFVILFACVVLTPSPSVVYLQGVPLPELCIMKRFLSVECLGCGLTRSVIYTAHGNISLGFELHKFGPIFFFYCCIQLLYSLYQITKQRSS